MLKFEYRIKLADDGRPYIDLPKDYQDNPEDKFMALELTRYILTNIYAARKNGNKSIDDNNMKILESTVDLLTKVSDEAAILIRKEMEELGQFELTTLRKYHIQVDTVKERDELNYEGILYNGKIYKRQHGLKVLVLDDMKVYVLNGGRDNEHWTIV